MARISFTNYKFNKPPNLTKDEYNRTRNLLVNNPKISLNPPSFFVSTFKWELIFILIGILGGYVAYLNIIEWLTIIGLIPLVLVILGGHGIFFSMVSFFGYMADKSIYYSRLKKDIKNSVDYESFLRNRSKK
jgi:hypothetical protein